MAYQNQLKNYTLSESYGRVEPQVPQDKAPTHDDLYDKLRSIDNKYSKNYIDPVVDLPETLGLVPISYQAPSKEQLFTQAEESTISSYLKNLEKIQASDKSGKEQIGGKILTAEEKLDKALSDIAAKLEQNVDQSQKKAISRGTVRGTILGSMVENHQNTAEKEKTQAKDSTNATIAALEQQLDQLAQTTQTAIENLDTVRDADIQSALAKLLSEVQKQQDAVTKYNNDIQEKETKYQTTRESAISKAKQQEYDRVFDMMKLYQGLGESGFQELVLSEKMSALTEYFSSLPKEEAQKLVQTDVIKGHAGKYYDYLVDYVSNLK